MADFKPQDAERHFALQRANRAAEIVKTVYDAQQKAGEVNQKRKRTLLQFARAVF